ncbi:MAG: hypothetical protein K6T35_01390 [Meiothermus silvanus]|uniref:NIPSNAP family containing protein n=1 Tax=Allomeiothermus silvanus (strain ATCC 700542 / DSM 9946 / NBRC 106475 / NCIMB 13440 / VI-R2) TaxID=526227 RepID=D7BAF2_ALLS1|nr:hypothetical protein [Allomeiothermus silvanus]ADH64287.1 hypothetical protein Mesil_2432 [Allomeiothermus silvanus DSM 9946]MCL6567557.1 hypothetical protein [Allomeiothermus silvanus]
MLLVRDVFQLHFGKTREALALIQEGRAIERRMGYPLSRVLVDVTGPYYTLVNESEFDSLGQLEAALGQMSQDAEWRQWYERFIPLVREGRREVYRVVE